MAPAWHFCLRPIPGHTGYYAGIDGSVWTMRKGGPSHWPPRRKPLRMRGRTRHTGRRAGSQAVTLSLGRRGKNVTREVRHLVWEAFHGDRPSGMSIWHHDGDVSNAALANLRCDTPSSVTADIMADGRCEHMAPVPIEERFTDSEIEHILTSPLSTKKIARQLRCMEPRILGIRRKPPERFLASSDDRERVLNQALPLATREHHREVLRWLVSRMLVGGLARLDHADRVASTSLTTRQQTLALVSFVRSGVLSRISCGLYQFRELGDRVERFDSDVVEHDGEEFRLVPGLDRIWVSRSGRVIGPVCGRKIGEKKRGHDKRGRPVVAARLIDGDRQVRRSVAALVWRAFRGKIPQSMYPAPIDGNSENARLENLEIRYLSQQRMMPVSDWDGDDVIIFDGDEFRRTPDEEALYASASGSIAYYDARHSAIRYARRSYGDGSSRCSFPRNGKLANYDAYTVVWCTFRGEVPRGYSVDCDGDRRTGALDSLFLREKRKPADGSRSSGHVLTTSQVLDIRSHPEVSTPEFARRLGVSARCVWLARAGLTYRDVETVTVAPATAEQRERVVSMMVDVGIERRLSERFVRDMNRDGYVTVSRSEVCREIGFTDAPYQSRVGRAIKHGIITRAGWQRYHARVHLAPWQWQDYLDSLQASPYQRKVLALRVRCSLSCYDDLPADIDERIAANVDASGRFRPGDILEATFSESQYRVVLDHLIDDGVIIRPSRSFVDFVDMPPRQQPQDKRPRLIEDTTEATVDQYRLALDLLSWGESLPGSAREAGIGVDELARVERVLRMDAVLSSLVSSGKSPDDVARIFSLPIPAATALLAHADRSDSGIHAPD
ncbi:HNH endonuclease signature motif containing protein [Aporhodopirellula aestuarii]|uniref:HNH endonuclease n=1 Tax=Aporhodopirellula aestuarii TaxID=2950107 RepID=A0ABT0TZ47_9BACT|nr:HNH endonuclease signature motif containing protein [Aporhodopirellula aestuarii]MCM2369654.1 HNH endonuclease [Aporhodopirellula aestuarii]